MGNWVCVQPDMSDQFELCRIQQRKIINAENPYQAVYEYFVITYYDGKELYSGSRKECQKWIDDHWVERRYLDQYGQRD